MSVLNHECFFNMLLHIHIGSENENFDGHCFFYCCLAKLKSNKIFITRHDFDHFERHKNIK